MKAVDLLENALETARRRLADNVERLGCAEKAVAADKADIANLTAALAALRNSVVA